LGVSAATIHNHERRVARRWGHGWSQRVAAQLKTIVKHQRMRVMTLMKKDAFFAIGEGEERALAIFVELVAYSDFTFSQERGAVFIARRRRFHPPLARQS
jgi:hypothetical protein